MFLWWNLLSPVEIVPLKGHDPVSYCKSSWHSRGVSPSTESGCAVCFVTYLIHFSLPQTATFYKNVEISWKTGSGQAVIFSEVGCRVTRSLGPWSKSRVSFLNRIICKQLWPPLSPDMTLPESFLWGLKRCTASKASPALLTIWKRGQRNCCSPFYHAESSIREDGRSVGQCVQVELNQFQNLIKQLPTCLLR